MKHGGATHKVFELSPCLLHNTILATDDDAHPTEIADLGAADDEGVDVETSAGKDTRHAGQDTWLILDQAVQHMPMQRNVVYFSCYIALESVETYFLNGCRLGGGVL